MFSPTKITCIRHKYEAYISEGGREPLLRRSRSREEETLAEPVWPRLKTRCGHIIIKYSNRHIRNMSSCIADKIV